MNKKNRLVAVLLTVALLLLAFLLAHSSRQAKPVTTPAASNAAAEAESDAATSSTAATLAAEGHSTTAAKATPAYIKLGAPLANSPEEQAVLVELQDLMDDAGRHSEAKAKAIAMAASGSDLQQIAAVNALRWIGGSDAKKTLTQLMGSAGEEVSGEALRALTHLLTEDLVAERPDPFDPALWKDAIQNAYNDAERESLFVLLSAHPPKDVVPVLLDLQESKDNSLAELATEYLETNTNGTEILNREQGEEWLAEHLQEQENIKTEEELEKERDAATNPQDLPRFAELKRILAEEAAKAENTENAEKKD
ncbi:MAG: hypothetical protein GX937_03280 [Lentisphaerae bacterium]|jgi:uncharacterized protein with von Willebrand factor type A (vWA) domain|nr:hypothetical protein [Lentisphaerota bacterium]